MQVWENYLKKIITLRANDRSVKPDGALAWVCGKGCGLGHTVLYLGLIDVLADYPTKLQFLQN